MKKFKLYTTPWCPYCNHAKRLLTSRGYPYEDVDVGNDNAKRSEASRAAGGWPTVPMIFVEDRFLGGYTELAALDRSGQLATIIAD